MIGLWSVDPASKTSLPAIEPNAGVGLVLMVARKLNSILAAPFAERQILIQKDLHAIFASRESFEFFK
jgi:hypothetical protein